MCEEINFKEGDEVEAFGLKGRVVTSNHSSKYPIHVDFENLMSDEFTADGRLISWHKEPSLKLIKKAKKPVKKWQWLYQIANGSFLISTDYYSSAGEMSKHYSKNSKIIKPILETEKEFYE